MVSIKIYILASSSALAGTASPKRYQIDASFKSLFKGLTVLFITFITSVDVSLFSLSLLHGL
jgi:hypothetical protein